MTAPPTGASYHRSFERDVARRARWLPKVTTTILQQVGTRPARYPLYLLATTPRGEGNAAVLLSGGVHGDEPAGVHACLDFLEYSAPAFADVFDFYVLPCINPTGYERVTAETASGDDVNRGFEPDTKVPECGAVQSWLVRAGLRFRVAFDLHEIAPYWEGEGFTAADNPRACYLYETVTDDSERLGRRMIDDLGPGGDVCDWPTIYGDINDGGVVAYPDGMRNPIYAKQTTLDGYLNGRVTGHSFTLETPLTLPIEGRVAIHLRWLETALTAIAEPLRS